MAQFKKGLRLAFRDLRPALMSVLKDCVRGSARSTQFVELFAANLPQMMAFSFVKAGCSLITPRRSSQFSQ